MRKAILAFPWLAIISKVLICHFQNFPDIFCYVETLLIISPSADTKDAFFKKFVFGFWVCVYVCVFFFFQHELFSSLHFA